MKRYFAILASVMMVLTLMVPTAFADVLPVAMNIRIGGYGEGLGVGSVLTKGEAYGWYGGYVEVASIDYITYSSGYISSSADDPHAGDYRITYSIVLFDAVSPGETICYIPIHLVSSVSAEYDVSSNGSSYVGTSAVKVTCPGPITLSSFDVQKTADGDMYSISYPFDGTGKSYFAVTWPADAATDSATTVLVDVYISGLSSPVSESDNAFVVPDLTDILLRPFQKVHAVPPMLTMFSTLFSTSIISEYLGLSISALIIIIILKAGR